MGIDCAGNKEQESNNEVPYYELLCSNIEKRFIFYNMNIKDLVAEVCRMEEAKQAFTGEDIIKIHERHGVTRKDFLRENDIYQDLFPDYNDCELCSQYFLTTAIPFCIGAISDKKEIVWRLLDPQKKGVEQKMLKDIVRMIIVLSVKTIPEMVLRDAKIKGDVMEDNDMILFLKSDDKALKEYVNTHYWNHLKQIQEENKASNSSSGFVSQYEYYLWMLKINEDKLLSSSGNRQQFLDFLKNQPEELSA